MHRLHRRDTRIDRLEQDARRNRRKGSLGKWVYLLVLLGLLVWLLNYFLGNLVFFSAQGFVTREEFRVSVPYPARLSTLDVEVGDDIAAGARLARVESLSIRETLAQIALAVAELERERSQLEARAAEIDALLPLARRRAARMEGLLSQNTDAYERGLTTVINRSRLIEDEFNATEKLATFSAERGEIDRQIALIEQQRADLAQRRAVFANAYDDGIVRAPVAGQVFDITATVGGVVRAADPILTLIGGTPHILAYVNPGSLAELPVGSEVRIEYGVREIGGRITRVFPLSRQLPAEFQRQFRPQERSQLIRIDFEEGTQVPPTFTKVTITSDDLLPSWLRNLIDRWRGNDQTTRADRTRTAAEPDEPAAPTVSEPAPLSGPATEETPPAAEPEEAAAPSSAGPAREQPTPRTVETSAPQGAGERAPDSLVDADALANVWRIQIASFDQLAAARTGLRRVRAAYRQPPGLSYVIVRMPLEERTVYRIQLGPFDSQSAALEHCEWLKETGRDCFVLAPE